MNDKPKSGTVSYSQAGPKAVFAKRPKKLTPASAKPKSAQGRASRQTVI